MQILPLFLGIAPIPFMIRARLDMPSRFAFRRIAVEASMGPPCRV
jgi:hypothetical protein